MKHPRIRTPLVTRTPIVALAACLALGLVGQVSKIDAASALGGEDDPRSESELGEDQRRVRSALLKLSDFPGGWERLEIDDDYFTEAESAVEDLPVCDRFVALAEEMPVLTAGFRAFAEKGAFGNEVVEQGVMVWPSDASAMEFLQNFGGSAAVRCRVRTIERVVRSRLESQGFEDVGVKVDGQRRALPQLGDDTVRIRVSLEMTSPEYMGISWDVYLIRAGRAVTELVLLQARPGDKDLHSRELVELTVERLEGVPPTS